MDVTHSHRFNPDTMPAALTLGVALTLILLSASTILSTEIMMPSALWAFVTWVSATITMCQKEHNQELGVGIAAGVVFALIGIAAYTLMGVLLNSLDNVNFYGFMADGSEGLPIRRGD